MTLYSHDSKSELTTKFALKYFFGILDRRQTVNHFDFKHFTITFSLGVDIGGGAPAAMCRIVTLPTGGLITTSAYSQTDKDQTGKTACVS